jgi:heme/copper-type cytochrome/quinol oxidase subunit 2
MNFQDPANKIMENLIDLHHDAMFIMVIIFILVAFLIFYIVLTYSQKSKDKTTPYFLVKAFSHNTFLETI